MSKNYRQGQILKIIRAKRVFTQEELAQDLSRAGIVATQVTLSRDLRDLRLVKTAQGYREITGEEGLAQWEGLTRELLRDIRVAQNLLVLKTGPGHANPLAIALDRLEWEDIAGTIAGDDTVLVVASDSEKAAEIHQRLLTILNR